MKKFILASIMSMVFLASGFSFGDKLRPSQKSVMQEKIISAVKDYLYKVFEKEYEISLTETGGIEERFVLNIFSNPISIDYIFSKNDYKYYYGGYAYTAYNIQVTSEDGRVVILSNCSGVIKSEKKKRDLFSGIQIKHTLSVSYCRIDGISVARIDGAIISDNVGYVSWYEDEDIK